MEKELKIVFVEKVVGDNTYRNYYLNDGEHLIPIEIKYFNPKQLYWDKKHLDELATRK